MAKPIIRTGHIRWPSRWELFNGALDTIERMTPLWQEALKRHDQIQDLNNAKKTAAAHARDFYRLKAKQAWIQRPNCRLWPMAESLHVDFKGTQYERSESQIRRYIKDLTPAPIRAEKGEKRSFGAK